MTLVDTSTDRRTDDGSQSEPRALCKTCLLQEWLLTDHKHKSTPSPADEPLVGAASDPMQNRTDLTAPPPLAQANPDIANSAASKSGPSRIASNNHDRIVYVSSIVLLSIAGQILVSRMMTSEIDRLRSKSQSELAPLQTKLDQDLHRERQYKRLDEDGISAQAAIETTTISQEQCRCINIYATDCYRVFYRVTYRWPKDAPKHSASYEASFLIEKGGQIDFDARRNKIDDGTAAHHVTSGSKSAVDEYVLYLSDDPDSHITSGSGIGEKGTSERRTLVSQMIERNRQSQQDAREDIRRINRQVAEKCKDVYSTTRFIRAYVLLMSICFGSVLGAIVCKVFGLE